MPRKKINSVDSSGSSSLKKNENMPPGRVRRDTVEIGLMKKSKSQSKCLSKSPHRTKARRKKVKFARTHLGPTGTGVPELAVLNPAPKVLDKRRSQSELSLSGKASKSLVLGSLFSASELIQEKKLYEKERYPSKIIITPSEIEADREILEEKKQIIEQGGPKRLTLENASPVRKSSKTDNIVRKSKSLPRRKSSEGRVGIENRGEQSSKKAIKSGEDQPRQSTSKENSVTVENNETENNDGQNNGPGDLTEGAEEEGAKFEDKKSDQRASGGPKEEIMKIFKKLADKVKRSSSK